MAGGNCSLADLSKGYFHEMDHVCYNNVSAAPGYQPVVSAMFYVQLVRLSLLVAVLLLLATMYNMISVMDRLILSSATCSLYWMLMIIVMIIKSVLLLVLVPLQWHTQKGTVNDSSPIEIAGFLVMAFLQSLATFLLFLALDHERQFRSADFATVDRPSKHCIALSCNRKLLLSWPRLVGVVLTCLPIGVLIAIEILYGGGNSETALSGKLSILAVYIATLPLARLAAVGVGVALMVSRSSKMAPSVMACVYLSIGLVLSLMEDFPNFVTNCNATANSNSRGCVLGVLTVFDVLQVLGVLSSIFFLLFVRSQYLRVEQESKLNLVWDLQKLLQVDGRKDIVRHKQYA